MSLLVSVSVARRSSFGGVVISPAWFGCSSPPPPFLYPPLSSTSRGTYQRHPPRKTLPPHLLFLVRSCCWSCWPFASFSCLVVRWFGGCVVLCVLRSGAAVLLWELRCCAAVRLCCCFVVLLRWSVLRVVCVSCVVLVWGACVSCLWRASVVLVCGACVWYFFNTVPVWCLCVLPSCGADHGWSLARLKTDTEPMLSLHRTSSPHCAAELHCCGKFIFCIALHCIALHCNALHCIALHCIALHCIALQCIALHWVALHCIALHCNALHCIVLS